MKNYFAHIETLEELKKEFRKLAFKHHPDVPGGSVEAMQEINKQYEAMINKLSGTGKASKEDDIKDMEEFKDIIEKLLNLEGLEIEIVGSWLWVSGDTKPHKAILKELKFFWNRSRGLWQRKPSSMEGKKVRYSKADDSVIKDTYGCQKVTKGKGSSSNKKSSFTLASKPKSY